MIFVLAAALGLVVAIVRGVSLSKVASVRFAALGLLVPAVGLRVLLNPLVMSGDFSARLAAPLLPGIVPLPLGSLLNLASFACALGFLYINRRLPGFRLILLGLALNVLVIALSGGQMPGDRAQLASAGLLQDQLDNTARGLWSPFSVTEPGSLVWLLSDIIYIPMPFREPTVASVGDLVIALGVVAFFNPKTRKVVGRQV
jgi:uncharacterized protein DUF5317